MTANEIIKHLENNVNSLDYFEVSDEEVLDLINRQQAEIERLQKANGLLKYLKEAVHRVEIGGKEEVVDYASDEAFYDAITKKINLMCNVQTAKDEAYKEFAERLKEKGTGPELDTGKYFHESDIDRTLTELTETKGDEGK